jgi:hypothetical protein
VDENESGDKCRQTLRYVRNENRVPQLMEVG